MDDNISLSHMQVVEEVNRKALSGVKFRSWINLCYGMEGSQTEPFEMYALWYDDWFERHRFVYESKLRALAEQKDFRYARLKRHLPN